MLSLSGSLVDRGMNLESQNTQTNLQPLSPNTYSPQQVRREELNLFMSKLLESNKQIISNQLATFNELTELEQRYDRIEQMASEHLRPPIEQAQSTKVWFENSFIVKEFRIDISAEESTGTNFDFNFPVIIRTYSLGLVNITLKWIRSDTSLSDNQREIMDKITNQMNLYLKKYEENFLDFYTKISPSSIDLQFLMSSSEVKLTVNYKYFPLSDKFKSFLCIGVSEDNFSKPAILLNDVIHISIINSSRYNVDSKIDALLLKLLKTKNKYRWASWYDRLVSLSKQKDLPEEGVKSLQGKRTRPEEVENPKKKARTRRTTRAVKDAMVQDYSQ
jgi:hypothetical protein